MTTMRNLRRCEGLGSWGKAGVWLPSPDRGWEELASLPASWAPGASRLCSHGQAILLSDLASSVK